MVRGDSVTNDDRPAPAPAGWYADPGGTGGWRYWDGAAWTSHTQDTEPRETASSTQPLMETQRAAPTEPVTPTGPSAPEQRVAPSTLPDHDVAPPPTAGTAVEPPSANNRRAPRSSGLGLLFVVVGLATGFAMGLGLGFMLWGWDDSPILAGEFGTGTNPAEHRDDTTREPAAEVEPDPARDADAEAADPGEDPNGPPDEPADEPTGPLTEDEPGAASPAELEGALEGYVRSVDSGDVDRAYGHVSPSLRRKDGWSYERFATFNEETITGSRVVRIDGVDAGSQRVDATVEFDLPDGGTSRETIRTRFVRGADGELLLDDYEVLDADRVD